jgi:hypothetical protein
MNDAHFFPNLIQKLSQIEIMVTQLREEIVRLEDELLVKEYEISTLKNKNENLKSEIVNLHKPISLFDVESKTLTKDNELKNQISVISKSDSNLDTKRTDKLMNKENDISISNRNEKEYFKLKNQKI